MSEERLRLIAEMRDRLTPQLRRLKQVMESTGRVQAFRKLASEMGLAERAGYRLGFALGRGLRYSAIAAAGGIAATTAAAGAAGVAMVRLGKQSADAMDDQAAFAKQIGFTGDTLRTLEGVAKRYNVEQDSLRNGLQKFNVVYGQLKQGQGAFLGYLKKTDPALAGQMRQVGSTQEAYLLLFDAMSKISDPAKRAALAKAAGIGQQSLRFLADGSDDLKKTITEVLNLQGVLGPKAFDDAAAYGDAMDNIGLAWQGLRDRLTTQALPIAIPILQDLADFMANNREEISSGFRQIATDVGGAMRDLGKWVNSDKGREFFAGLWPELQKVGAAFRDIALSVKDLVGAIKDLGGWKAVIGAIIAYKALGGVPGLLKLGADAVPGGAKPGSGKKDTPTGLPIGGPMTQWFLYQLGKAGIEAVFDALPKPAMPEGYDPKTFDPLADLQDQLQKLVAPRITKDGTRTQLDPSLMERAQRSANAYRADPEGTRGRMGTQLYRRGDVETAAKTLAEVDAAIASLKENGGDKKFAERFAALVAQRNAIAARIEQERAADVGKKIGTSAADSFFDRVRTLFQTMSYQGGMGGMGGMGGGLQQAVYRPGSGGAQAIRAAYSGPAGEVPANMTAGADRAMRMLVSGGLSQAQAAAMAGNLQQESSFNPNSLNRKEGAHGIMQWRGQRWTNLQKFAAERGGNPNDFGTQLAFIRYELAHGPGLSPGQKRAARAFLAAGNIEDANRALHGFISYGDNTEPVRRNNARDILKRHQRQQSAPAAPAKLDGSASLDVRFHNAPAGTRVASRSTGLFREVNLDVGRSMRPALA